MLPRQPASRDSETIRKNAFSNSSPLRFLPAQKLGPARASQNADYGSGLSDEAQVRMGQLCRRIDHDLTPSRLY
jgi:hypothetical protein